jgi:hypothetical protein
MEQRINRRRQVKKTLLTAAAAVALGVVVFSGNAQAQCWWTGLGYSCASPPAAAVMPQAMYYQDPYVYSTPYPAWNSYDYQNYRLRPDWLPSQPGPRPGGH